MSADDIKNGSVYSRYGTALKKAGRFFNPDDPPDWWVDKQNVKEAEPTTWQKAKSAAGDVVDSATEKIVDTFSDETAAATEQAQEDYTDYNNQTYTEPEGLGNGLQSAAASVDGFLSNPGGAIQDQLLTATNDSTVDAINAQTDYGSPSDPVTGPTSNWAVDAYKDNVDWWKNTVIPASQKFIDSSFDDMTMGTKGVAEKVLAFTPAFVKSTELYNNFNFQWGTPEKNEMAEELGRAYGVDSSIFFNDRDAYIKGAQILANFKIDSRLGADVDRNSPEAFRAYLKEYYPTLIGNDPETFASKIRNAEDVKQVHEIFKTVPLALEIWANTAERGSMYTRAWFENRLLTDDEIARAKQINDRLKELSKVTPQLLEHPLLNVLTQTGVQVSGMVQDAAFGIAVGLPVAGATLAATGNPALAKTAGSTAFKVGSMVGMFVRQVGDKYVEYLSYQNNDGSRTLTPRQAQVAATIETAIETGFEFWNYDAIMRTLGGKERAAIQDIVQKNHGNAEAIRGGLKAYLANMVKAWAPRAKEEILEEGYQSAADDLVHNAIVLANPNTKEKLVGPGEMVENAADAMTTAVPSVLGMVIGGDIISNIRGVRSLASLYEANKEFNEEQVANAELNGILNDLKENQDANNLRKENPRAYMQVIKEEADAAGIPNVYVDTEMVMEQPGGKEILEKLGEQSGYSPEQIKATIEAKGNMEVPTAVYCQVALPSAIGDKVIDMTTSSPDANSQARIKSTVDRVTRMAKNLAEQDEKEVSDIIPTIVENNFHTDEERKLATEIISSDPSHIDKAYKEAVRKTQQEYNDMINGALETEEADSYTNIGAKVIQNENLYNGQILTTYKVKQRQKFWTDYFGQKTPTQAQKRQYAYDVLTGAVKGGPRSLGAVYDMAMKNGDTKAAAEIKDEMKANKERLDGLQHNLDVLKGMADKLGKIPNVETTITRGLTPEGYRVYQAANTFLSNSNNAKVKKQARQGAVIFARECESLAREMTAQGKKTTAEDVARMLDVDTNAHEANAIAGGFSQKSLKAGIRLKKDAANWRNLINHLNELPEEEFLPLVRTPLVLQEFANFPDKELKFGVGKIRTALREHPELTEGALKQLPEAIANPIAVFSSETQPGRYVIISGVIGDDGANIVVPVGFNGQDGKLEIINYVATSYTKSNKNGSPKKKKENLTNWYRKRFENRAKGDLKPVYINEKKVSGWYNRNRLRLPALKYRAGDFFNEIIPNENDLSNLRIENPGYYQTAWHGSPYDFDEFSLDHMGEGEGAQAHGWGLYFAADRKTSEGYQHMRDELDSPKVNFNGKQYTVDDNVGIVDSDGNVVPDDTPLYEIVLYSTPNVTKRELLDFFKEREENAKKNGFEEDEKLAKEAYKMLSGGVYSVERASSGSKLYKVDVPETKDLLDEQKPLSEMSDSMLKRLESAYNELDDFDKDMFASNLLSRESFATEEEKKDKERLDLLKKAEAALKWYSNISESETPEMTGTIFKQALSKIGYDSYAIDDIIHDTTRANSAYNTFGPKYWDEMDELSTKVNDAFMRIDHSFENAKSDFFGELKKSKAMQDITGAAIYDSLETVLDDDAKRVSLLLNKHGIKGITYDGRQDGRCYVVFDDKAISIIEKYDQKRARIQGQTSFPNGKPLISLFEAADQSTFMHETAHWYLDTMRKLALNPKATRQFTEDFYTLQQWFGNKKFDAEITVEQHEKFARGFEAYLRNGKAPAPQLKSVFNRFKNWLVRLYRDFRQLGGKPPEDVMKVMDRMLATQDEIDLAMKEQMVDDFKRAGGMKIMTDTNMRTWERWYNRVKTDAAEKVMKKAVADIAEADNRDINEAIELARQQATEKMKHEPFWIADEAYRTTGDANILATFNLTPEEYQNELKKRGGSFEAALNAQMEGFEKETRDSAMSGEEIAEEAKKAVQTSEYQEYLHALEYEALAAKAREYLADKDEQARKAQEKADKKVAKENAEREAAAEKEQKIANKLTMQEEARNAKVNEAKAETAGMKKGMRIVRDTVLGTVNERRSAARIALSKIPISQATNVALWARKLGQKQQAAYTFMTRGEWDKAAHAKQEQLLYAAMLTEAGKLKVQIDKQANAVRKRVQTLQRGVERMPTQERYWYQHLAFVLGLSRGDAVPPAYGVRSLSDVFAATLGMDSEGAPEVAVPQWLEGLANQTNRVGLEKLSPNGWNTANNILKALYHVGMDRDKLLVVSAEGVNPTISETAMKLAENAIDHVGFHNKEDVYSNNTSVDKGKQNIREAREYTGSMFKKLLQPMTILQRMDGYEGKVGRNRAGLAIKTLYDSVQKATNAEAVLMADFHDGLANAFSQYTNEELDDLRNKRVYRFGNRILTKENIMAMALTSGTDSGYKRILDNEDIGREFNSMSEREQALAAAVNEAFTNLDERDWNTVAKVWELMGKHYADESGVKERTTGIPLGKLPHRAFSVRGKDGKQYNLSGGYYPVVYDSRQSLKANDLETQDQLRSMAPGALRMGQGKGFTKNRVDTVTGRPLLLTFDTISRKGGEMMHYIAMRETALDINRIIGNGTFADTVKRTLGMDEYKILRDWASDIWQPRQESSADWARFVRAMRSRTTAAILAYRTSTMLLNASNASLMMEQMGTGNFIDAIKSFYSDPKTNWQFINRASPFMAQRSERMDTNLREAMEKSQLEVKGGFSKNPVKAAAQKLHAAIQENGFKLIGLTDNMFAYPLWMGEYKRVLNEELRAGKTNDVAQEKAISAGDRAVIRVIGSGEIKDLSPLQKGGEFAKVFTMFYTFQNALYNQLANKYYAGKQAAEMAGKTGMGRFISPEFIAPMAHHLLFGVMLGAAFEMAVRGAMGAVSGEDKDKKKDASYWLRKYAETATGNTAATVPVLRDFWRYASNGIFWPEEPFSFKKDGVKVTSAFDPVVQAGNAVVTINGALHGKSNAADVVREGGRFLNRVTGSPDMITDGISNAMQYFSNPERERDFMLFLGTTLMDKKYPKAQQKKKGGKNAAKKKKKNVVQ